MAGWSNSRFRAIVGKCVTRYCPACRASTYADGDGKRRCGCGWHEGMAVVMPDKPKLVDPAREVRETKGR